MNNENKLAIKVTIKTIIVNLILSIIKFIVGILAKSGAMTSDAVHSASDVFSSVIVIIGVNAAGKDSDEEHPYGHERMECVAALILSTVLFITGILIGYAGIEKILAKTYNEPSSLESLALIAAIISIITKEIMYWYTRHYAKKLNSSVMMADAWHHRSDALSSVGALIGIGTAMLGFRIAEPIAGIIICLFIIKAAYDIFMDSVSKMVDTACDCQTVEQIKSITLSYPQVKNIDKLMTRLFGSKIYVDMEFSVDGNMTLYEAHAIAHQIHDHLERDLPQIKHCMLHVNPYTHSDLQQ